jgi:hypothetical protein
MFVLPQQGAGAGTAPHVSPTFCTPASVGLYCDVQSGSHCGAHALNALLGKQAIPGPDFCVPHLSKVYEDVSNAVDAYSPSGDYSISGLSTW